MSSVKTSKKILFVTRPLAPPWDEASKNFAYDLACNILEHEITILVDEFIDDAPEYITQQKIYSSNNYTFLQKIRSIFYLLRHAKEYDAVHLLYTAAKLNSWIMRLILPKKVRVIQTIATVRDDLYKPHALKKMYFGDILVTYSQWAQNKLEKLDFENVAQIYPGIDLTKFTTHAEDHHLIDEWNIALNEIVITYPGEYTRLGATDTIIDAFIEIWKDPKNDHIKYLCACRIKNEADLHKKAQVIKKITKAGHRKKVIFTDTFSDMNAIYNLSDIIIFPVENMHGKFDVPLAMIEPYACKKPVIASDLPLFREFSDTSINVIIPKGNSTVLKDTILQLINDPVQQKILGENAYDFAHKTFNIEKIAQAYEKLYTQL